MKKYGLKPSRTMRKGGAASQQPRPPSKIGSNVRPSFRSTKIEKALKQNVASQMDVEAVLQQVNTEVSKEESKKESALRGPSTSTRKLGVTDKFAWNMASPVADQRRIMRFNEEEYNKQIETFQNSGEQPLSSPSKHSSAALSPKRKMKFAFGSPQRSPTRHQSPTRAKPITSIEADMSVILGSEEPGAHRNAALSGALDTAREYNSIHGPKSPSKLDPKVFVPYGKINGTINKTPRAIEVERKKVSYLAEDIESLLANEGVPGHVVSLLFNTEINNETDSDGQSPTQENLEQMMPIELFDSRSFDVRKPMEWITLGQQVVDGSSTSLMESTVPARGLRKDTGMWEACSVFDYNEERGVYLARWMDKETFPAEDESFGSTAELTRLQVCFNSEDPKNFARRIAFAYGQRKIAQALIRYNLYIDCMPIDGVGQLDSEQINRIVGRALNTLQLKHNEFDTNQLLTEVNTDYSRTMNKIIFDSNLKFGENAELVKSLSLLVASMEATKIKGQQAPDIGVVETPEHDFAQQFSTFAFQTFLAQREVVSTLIAVNSEKEKILAIKGLLNDSKRALKLDEYKSIQDHTRRTFTRRMDEWGIKTIDAICTGLESAGKGHYNLDETERNVYKYTKMNGLLHWVNFMMEDALKDVTDSTIYKFYDYIKKLCEGKTTIQSPSVVEFEACDERGQRMASQTVKPLFFIEIKQSDEKVMLNEMEVRKRLHEIEAWKPPANDKDATCDLDPIEPKHGFNFEYSITNENQLEAILTSFDKFMKSTVRIEQVEHRVMKNLLWSRRPLLKAVPLDEKYVISVRSKIEDALRKCHVPLNQYLKMFDKHIEFLNVDLAAIEEKYRPVVKDGKSSIRLNALCKVIREHLLAIDALNHELPSGPVRIMSSLVSCKSIREMMKSKRNALANMLQDLLAEHIRTNGKRINQEFQSIDSKLKVSPKNIEELKKQHDFMGTVNASIAELKTEMSVLFVEFDTLESFRYEAADLFNIRWTIYGWPKKISTTMENTQRILEQKKREYSLQMADEQVVFEQTLVALESEVMSFSTYQDIRRYENVESHRLTVVQKIEKAKYQVHKFNSRETLFEQELTDYSQLDDIVSRFEPFDILWKTTSMWITKHDKWLNGKFNEVQGFDVDDTTTLVNKDIRKAGKILSSLDLNGCAAIAKEVERQVVDFMPHVPFVMGLRNPGMRKRHWDDLSEKIGIDIHPEDDDDFTLQMCFDMNLHKHGKLIAQVGETAGKEYQIESSLNKMQEEWKSVQLQVIPYEKCEGTYILKGVDELMAILDEHITMTQATAFSPFKGPFEERIEAWNRTLQLMSDVIDEWIILQRNWLYLQPIFDSDDIMKQLPTEAKRFRTVDKNWRKSMHAAFAKPDPVAICGNDKLLKNYQESNKLMDLVQKGLAEYLETKRTIFTRFYFLSNDELLSILSQTKDVTLVQPHLKKCFEGINRVEFGENNMILKMISREKEKMSLKEPIDPTVCEVEYWMTQLEDMMRVSVREHMKLSIQDYFDTSRPRWMQKWQGMCVLNGSQFHWTKEMEEAMKSEGTKGLQKMLDKQVAQLADMTILVRGKLNKNAKTTIGALTVVDVHAREVTKKLINEGVSSKDEFLWLSQMRYYWEDEDLSVEMVAAKRPYGYEYLGNSFRLVITPLTDKCYLTLMGALQMILGGAPAGPAGTGKTETTKDLAKALAKQCVVFNCSDGLDYQQMGKFFKGLASCGAWACFDEFNRIEVEVLSVVAQQIITLQSNVRLGNTEVEFEGSKIKLNAEFSVFITMNPGYAGRAELPDNLKACFRPVAMMVPDYALIGEIMLFAYGFELAKECGAKMVATFRLCSEQLSSQYHYDYGMRAVKTVIVAAGNLKAKEPEANELQLLLRALQDVNLPKFLSIDLPLFEGIISDLFPGISRPDIDYGALMQSLKLASEEAGLQPVEFFLRKNIQLYETIVVRHGLMIVGPTGAGKTKNLSVLSRALTMLKENEIEGNLFEKVHHYTMNPKAITMGQLYGERDPNTLEFVDGVLPKLYRNASSDQSTDRKFVIFDGPVDAIWIENMNTVLDDNKKLCLNSGEMLQMSDTMSMIFEVNDLSVASPATVSRCGMVYMEPRSLGLNPLILSWMDTLPEVVLEKTRCRTILVKCFDTYLQDGLQILRRFNKEPVPTVDGNLTQSLTRILDCYFYKFFPREGVPPHSNEDLLNIEANMESLFLFALTWSVGATSDQEGRNRFSSWLKSKSSSERTPTPYPEEEGTLVYDFMYNEESQEWVKWMNSVGEVSITTKDISFSEIVVPTKDSVRTGYLIEILIRSKKHILFTGSTGTGKTTAVMQFLSGGGHRFYSVNARLLPLTVTFSAQTSQNQTQDYLDSKMEKRKKGTFGPPAGKEFIIYIDDLNMPQREKYFAQPPLELIRQCITQGGWYDRKTLDFMKIIDKTFIASMGPPGGGRNPITARLKRHFNIINLVDYDDTSKALIFSTILEDFLSVQNFEQEIIELQEFLVNATIRIYNRISAELLPTPQRVHYTFNLRDLAGVFQGLLMCDSKHILTSESFARLWVHECRRVFQDRLINTDDTKWFDEAIKVEINENCEGLSFDDVVPRSRIFFGAYVSHDGAYEEIPDETRLQTTVEEYLENYNDENTKEQMHLVMFLDAIDHVSRIARVLRQPQGNALCLGVGGSGRQSLTRLATFICEYSCFQVEIIKGYSVSDWREDVKTCLLRAGVQQHRLTFLFSDTQIVHEQMVEDINNLLNSGDLPNLYSADELESIMSSCRSECQKKKIAPTPVNIFAQYLIRVRKNIHLVVCMSPLGDAFRNRLRMFPALVNCCTIDWFMPWPDDALRSVAQRTLADENLKLSEHSDNLVEMFKVIHQSVESYSEEYRASKRYNYVTPTSYLSILSTYKKELQEKRKEINGKIARLANGLDKLKTTKADVSTMQESLVKMQPELKKTSIAVDEMMVKITADKAVAEETKIAVQAEEKQASEIAAKAKGIADSAQADLDEALPALDAALKSLDKLKKNDLDEVKALKTPPIGVKLTMEACCIMFQVKPEKIKDPNNPMGKKINDYWGPSRKHLLDDPKALLLKLKGFDKGNIPEQVIQTIGPYIEMEEFQPKAIEKASKACTAICMWVHAMNKYHWISISVEPKRIALREAEAELAEGTKRLESARSQLKAVLDNIRSLETQFSNAVSKKEALEDEMERCKIRLDSAMKLIGGLGGEESRWEKTVISLKQDYGNLIGDVVVSAGQISYSGAFPADFRLQMKTEWIESMVEMSVPHSKNTSIISVLGNPVKIQGWQINGLPADDVSTENGIIIDKAARWPLMIDPQGQANRYIKNLSKEVMGDNFDVGKESDKNFMRTLENGVRFGKWILLENVGESLDAAFEPVLLKQTFRQGMSLMIRLGDNVIPYNDTFRFFITTKLPNPHYAPEVCVKVTLINFAITPKGLEEQLLAETIQQELPDVAQKKSALVLQNAAMNKELTEIEDRILFLLSSAEGNILDNVEVINALDEAKQTSVDIGKKMKEAEVTEKQIDASRESYRPVAAQASVLFFCIVDLAIVDPMYQYSLLWFTQLFILGNKDSEPSADLKIRMQNLKDYFAYLLYENVCRSLFEKHKLLFAFLLCIRLLQSRNEVDPSEWRFLISGNTAESDTTNHPGGWVDTRTWTEIQSLSSLSVFRGLASNFDLNAWKNVFDSATPEKEPYPGKWDTDLNRLQKMCILRALRPDKVIESMQLFVTEKIGQRFIEPPPFDLPLSFRPSTVTTALVFVLSPGSDPMKDLFNFAESMKMRKKFNAISLGQGQGPRAEKMMQVAMQKGEWVFLQNCHLMTSWMPRLEQLCESIDTDKVHKDFRLWLSSMPDKNFPVSVLQNSIKMTNEPPRGLRANLQNTYYRLDDDKLNLCSKSHEYKKLLFALSFFHALVIERKKFGPLGWNGCLSYEFNDTDFDICQSQLCLYLDKYEKVPYSVLSMLTEAINYGGRVTDDKDMRTIEVIMKKFYCENVMDDSYAFSTSGLYKSFGYDPDAPYDSYTEYIASLPINPNPEAFGMHDNANITCAQNETYETFDVLLSLQSTGSSSGSGTSPEQQMLEAARGIQRRLPVLYDEEAIGMAFPVDYNESMNTVLTQEVKRFNKLLRVMKESLKQAERALQGFVLMSGELESLVNSLYNNKVPEVWENNGYISLKPLKAWTDDLMQRLQFLQVWIDNGTPNAFWISGFFFPQAFVTGTKQNFARKMQYPIDTIAFDFVVKDDFKVDASDIESKPKDGCYMYGLFLEAARWNNETHVLDDPRPKELYSAMPVIQLDPIQNRPLTMKNVYHCPVYKVLTRRGQLSTTGHSTNFVMWIELPSDKKTIFRKSLVSETNAQVNFADSEEWVNGGVALFCALRM